jgi:hypothetical protein
MVYNAPVLVEVGQAANLVLGFDPGTGDGAGGGLSMTPALALGLDE